MHRFLVLTVVLALTVPGAVSLAQESARTDDENVLHALGLALSQRLSGYGFTEAELDLIAAGLKDGVLADDALIQLQEFGPKIDGMMQERKLRVAAAERAAGSGFVEAAAQEPGAERTASGAVYREVKPGSGEPAQATDRAVLHYHGTLIDGRVFDSSVDGGAPAEFVIGEVIPCLSEGLQKMRVGGKARLVCPADTAYGDAGAPPMIPGGATIVFEVELLGTADNSLAIPAEEPTSPPETGETGDSEPDGENTPPPADDPR